MPDTNYFKPAGIPLRELEEIIVTVEEAEAIRLKDIEELDQEHGAERMNISRATFQRILESSRKKIADAILNGKAIRIDGGNFMMEQNRFRCGKGHEWNLPFEAVSAGRPDICPTCRSTEITPLQAAGPGRCRRRQITERAQA